MTDTAEMQALRTVLTQIADKTTSSKDLFEGEPDEDYKEWKDGILLDLSLVSEGARIRTLLSRLGRRPKAIVAANIPIAGSFSAVNEIWTILDGTYGDNERATRARIEFNRFYQKGLALSEFNQKFDILCAQAGITGDVRKDMYIAKLNQDISDRIILHRDKTYQQLKELASLAAPYAERAYKSRQKDKEKGKRDSQGRFQSKAANIDPGNRINCWNCNKPGHVVHQCEQPKDQTRIRKARERTQANRQTRREIPPRDEMDLNQTENLEGKYEQTGYARFEIPQTGKGAGSNGPTHGSIQNEEL